MGNMMVFPATVEEFMEQYKVTDTEQVYTNGIEFVPIFRMKQWFEHLQAVKYTKSNTNNLQSMIPLADDVEVEKKS